MLKTVEGIFRKGRIKLQEAPPGVDEAKVLVTFLPGPGSLTKEEWEELRWRLEAWETDWNAPGMEAYNEL